MGRRKLRKKTPEAAQAFISKTRIHLENMLKIMIRGEADTSGLTIGRLRDQIKKLNRDCVTPWNRHEFKDLVNQMESCPEISYMESSHHSTGLTLGMAEAAITGTCWHKNVSPQLNKAFRAIREYRLLHGESKAMQADPARRRWRCHLDIVQLCANSC